MSKFLSKELVLDTMDLVGSTIFTVTFERKDGSVRVMNGRKGVHKNLKGTGKPRKDVITLFDVKKDEYRSVNPSRVMEMKVRGAKLSVAN